MLTADDGTMVDDVIRLREEITEQYRALAGMKKMAESYGFDISKPAKNAAEACPVVILWISCSYQDTEWCSNVSRTYFNIP